VIFAVAEICSITSASQISCEKIQDNTWSYVNAVRICTVQKITIPAEGYEFASLDASVTGLEFKYDSNMSFLPIRVDKAFPRLLAISAQQCSLIKISRENFRNLIKLKVLWLLQNQITTIYRNTFVDLVALEWLDLGEKILFEI
jgi:Leucine-rich repeat (LRR) protein